MYDSVEELEEQLGQWASGSPSAEAAVELLIETAFWLSRAEFVDRALRVVDGGVAIDWDVASVVATDVQCSRGERFLLQLACSFADPQKTVAMSEVSTLDGRNLKRVIEATETAKFGWR